jgi:hypothetical protein
MKKEVFLVSVVSKNNYWYLLYLNMGGSDEGEGGGTGNDVAP